MILKQLRILRDWKEILIFSLCLSILSPVWGQNIKSTEALTFPAAPATSLVIGQGQVFNAVSGKSIVLRTGTHFQQGSLVNLKIENSYTIPSAPSNPASNLDMNWIQTRGFDASGLVISEQKSFYDNNGRALQAQYKETEKGHVLASQVVYDAAGRASLQTLTAPTNNSEFAYKADFVQNTSGTAYDFKNFDRYQSGGPYIDKIHQPDPVGSKNTVGTLGWYYGPNNSWEPFNDVTDYPYSRQAYAYDGSGIPTRSGGPGDAYRMGAGHEGYIYSVPVNNELSHYWSVRKKIFDQTELGQNLDGSAGQPAQMTVAVDADGKSSFTISLGGSVLVSGSFGSDLMVENTFTSGLNYFGLPENGSISVFPVFNEPVDVEIDNLITGQKINYVQAGNNIMPGWYSFKNRSGNPIVIQTSLGFKDLSYNFYNQHGELVASIAPEGVKQLIAGGIGSYSPANRETIPFITLYRYDRQGRLVWQKNPDEAGASEFVYRKDGNIRFSQNAKQRADGRFSYSNYDIRGRLIEVGEFKPSGTTLAFNADLSTASAMRNILEATDVYGGLPNGTKYDVVRYRYDVPDATHGSNYYAQDSYYLRGAVSVSEKYSSIVNNTASEQNLISRSWFNYNAEGQLDWQIKYVNGLGYKTTDFSYDEFGAMIKQVYQRHVPAEFMAYYYEYDKDRRLATVYTNTVDNPSSKLVHAKYQYYLHGPLKRIELAGNLQGIDYVYTADGKLKTVNHAEKSKDPGKDGSANDFAPDVFGFNLEYHTGDYKRANTNITSIQTGGTPQRYSGLMNGISWHSLKPSSVAGPNNPVMNTYVYDSNYQLMQNNWGAPNFTAGSFTATANANQEKNLTYDAHGNIKTLTRTNSSGSVLANYQYNYTANTNKLASVSNYASYTYDALGQLASETKGSLSKYLDYDAFGKVTKIYSDAAKTNAVLSFVYDEGGNRIKKQDHLQNVTTWYVDGNVYNGSQLIEQPIPSGIFYRSGNVYRYQLTDHVGSVRAIINRNKLSNGTADVVYSADYYPFGSELQTAGIPSRYGYQGEYAEKDGETGWNNFYLRNYDPAIGRWLSIDPYGQYYSPYVGMGNNPVSGFDPDGGWSKVGAWIRRMDSWIAGESPSRLMKSGSEWGFNTLSDDGTIRGHYTGGVSLGRQFADNTPFVGTSLKSGDKLVAGNYGGAAIDFVQSGLELYMIAYDQTSKIANAVLQTFSKNVATKTVTSRLQAHVTRAAQEVDALGDAAFTIRQLKALQRHPNLRPMYRGNRIDVRARGYIVNDPALKHLKSNYSRGADFVDPKTLQWWDITTLGEWQNHVNKYGSGGTLLLTQ
ncbi:hypothetical protein FAZ19_05805 [Sphingobacterium alkalisoli]|uniref:RHS repeat-associated core domain-containing protein n=1 Tax=Sphingobacterium alkalisoli TaxID=1874115 RepID=A0A4U0H4E2_9SPHI|nr:RHS repeat-associated core domain-containing protein [Sphingobacterium alkalisoli]TJY66436.1 hypothetical protein FAZ19_05805 [Sphingobacterium alkalisoli]GGH16425.1 hypothetical protein GCM10011418_18780 [Sphingobacterium alkalisoli]